MNFFTDLEIRQARDRAAEKQPTSYAAFAFGNEVFILSGNYAKEFDPLFRRVYVSKSPFRLYQAKTGLEVAFDGTFQPAGGPVPPEEVVREQKYYVELNGAVYCVAGRAPGPDRSTVSTAKAHADVWRTLDGLNWTKILEKGPWMEGAADESLGFTGHDLFVCDGRMWLAGGNPQDREFEEFKVWSSSDGVEWTMEAELPGAARVTNIYSFRGEQYIRAVLRDNFEKKYSAVNATWMRGFGNTFVRVAGPWEDYDNYGRPAFFAWRNRLWAAFDCGILISDDGSRWQGLFNQKESFNQSLLLQNDSLWVMDVNKEIGKTSQDGLHWVDDNGRESDYLPISSGDFHQEYTLRPAVLEYRNSLWIVTGHPRGTWRSEDGLSWKRIEAEKGGGLIPRRTFAAAVFRDRLWVLGGRQSTFDSWHLEVRKLTLNDAWSTADGRVWQREADAPWFQRQDAKAVFCRGTLYLAGGRPAAGNSHHYLDIWKTVDGRHWEKIGDYRDLWTDYWPIDELSATFWRGSLLLYDLNKYRDAWRLSADGRWERLEGKKTTKNSQRKEPWNLKNTAVAKGPDGRERMFAWDKETLYYSDDAALNDWQRCPCVLEGPARQIVLSSGAPPRLVAFRGGLYLVTLKEEISKGDKVVTPESAIIRLLQSDLSPH